MSNLRIAFDQPWWLLLLLLVPLLWIFSFRSLSGLGPYRRIFALLFRTVVFALLVLALAGIQLQKISDRVTVIYLLDQSESIPKPTREAMLEYVMKDVELHRRKGDLTSATEDKAGVIIFGREATIEFPPFADEIRAVGRLESLFDLRTDATNIASALKLAQASFPEDSAKRIVIVTDGNENLGDARTVASTLAAAGIGIDVVPIQLDLQSEIAVEKIVLPPDIRRGQPIEARVVLENYTKQTPDNSGEVSGRLVVTRRYGNQDEPLGDVAVTLKPGKNPFSFEHKIDVPAGYTYRAAFVPDDPRTDVMQQNNSASTFTHVRGKGRVLLIEDWESPGEFENLIQRLGEKNIEVELMRSDSLFTSLAELQGFDCVILGNVPRASGGETDKKEATNFSDEQIAMLVRNTEQFGCGLVMIGGASSFGAGGWTNTELEKAMPVDFQIQNAKVKAVGALVMMMHASEIPDGNHWQKVIAEEALKVLGPSDYCGCLYWDNFTGRDASWLWKDGLSGKGLAQVRDRQRLWMGKIGRMAPGDMPAFEPAMVMALREFIPNPASIKHMIIISDGDPSPPSNTVLRQYKSNNIKVSTVAVGAHGPAESALLQNIATTTGGKFYRVNNPKALPRIFQIEARRVARPLVKEDSKGIPLIVEDQSHEMLVGLEPPQPVTGFVLTTRKENPLVEVLIRAKDIDAENGTILAAWRYGAGKTVALTTDAGRRWASSWTAGEEYDKFFSQMIRWAMRPVNEEGKFNIATDVKDGQVRVVVTALDKNDEFLNFLNMSGAGTGPDMGNVDLQFRQEAPGRYVAEFAADKSGSYLLAINTGQTNAPPLLTGISVPYSAEYREREPNQGLLTTLASTRPAGGQPGQLVQGRLEKGAVDRLVASVDTFRRTLAKAMSSEDFWPIFLLIAALIFFLDVFIRRVTVHFYWVTPALAYAYNRVLGRQQEPARDERLERLRSRKAAISSQIDERRASARFEPVADELSAQPRDYEQVLTDASGGSAGPSAPRPAAPDQSQTPQSEQETYTERLLAAKKKAKGQ
jgi:uncharacterized membrane protein/Mg-chelatase subunit ChlD